MPTQTCPLTNSAVNIDVAYPAPTVNGVNSAVTDVIVNPPYAGNVVCTWLIKSSVATQYPTIVLSNLNPGMSNVIVSDGASSSSPRE